MLQFGIFLLDKAGMNCVQGKMRRRSSIFSSRFLGFHLPLSLSNIQSTSLYFFVLLVSEGCLVWGINFFEGRFTKADVFLLPVVCYIRRDGGFVYDIRHKAVLFYWAFVLIYAVASPMVGVCRWWIDDFLVVWVDKCIDVWYAAVAELDVGFVEYLVEFVFFGKCFCRRWKENLPITNLPNGNKIGDLSLQWIFIHFLRGI